jgi:predicted transcriptional regulator
MKKHLRTGAINALMIKNQDDELISDNVIKHTYLAGSKEQFYLGYVTMLSIFQNISAPAIKIYAFMLERYNAGVMIGVNKAVKTQMKEHMGFKGDSTINNALTELVKVGLLYKQKDVYGAFFINPRHAFKGSTRDRDNLLKTVLELHCPDC